jgi:hypothetical protein
MVAASAVRFAPTVIRSIWNESPGDAELLICSTRFDDPHADGEVVEDFWAETGSSRSALCPTAMPGTKTPTTPSAIPAVEQLAFGTTSPHPAGRHSDPAPPWRPTTAHEPRRDDRTPPRSADANAWDDAHASRLYRPGLTLRPTDACVVRGRDEAVETRPRRKSAATPLGPPLSNHDAKTQERSTASISRSGDLSQLRWLERRCPAFPLVGARTSSRKCHCATTASPIATGC